MAKANDDKRAETRQMVQYRTEVNVTIDNAPASNNESNHNGYILDITKSGIGICTGQKLIKGTHVTVEILGQDYAWTIKGKTIWCNELPLSGIIMKEFPINYRVGIGVDTADPDITKIMENLMAYLCPRDSGS